MSSKLTSQRVKDLIGKLILTYGSSDTFESFSNPYDCDIFLTGMVDSFSVISIIALIEEEYQITITSDYLNSDKMRTINGIADIIISLSSI